MGSDSRVVVVLGTGGTIAGEAASASDNVSYRAAARPVDALLAGLGAAGACEAEQVAQLDSKDMDVATWRVLAARVAHHLARDDVAGVVVTHGTDTIEETAYFLQRVLAPTRPVVLTGAMRPATSRQADGPQNMADAIAAARHAGAAGVLVAFAGAVHAARDVRKAHPYRLDPFTSGDAGVVARVEEGALRELRRWPHGEPLGLDRLPADAAGWPWVEIVSSAAGARAATVDALRAAGVHGLVVAGSGNGSVHRDLEAALLDAARDGLPVLRSTRCLDGRVIESSTRADDRLPSAGDLTPVKARIELMLRLLAG
ncbi:asparaginase [Piscinibacter koreensis]|uniref:Asparaginase n=1 Tax=Piscinibacter koreensis TaxID=2742824 RepID=A0A7Y6TY60_9BURK|nr:asparaginase [Schlegelella koreensis]NUZ07790.1 asparaginase [Schlegelella koreensis]